MNGQGRGSESPTGWSARLWCAWAGLPLITMLILMAVACLPGPPARLAAWGLQRHAVAQLYAAQANWAGDGWAALTLLGDTTVSLMLLAPVAMWRPQAFMAVVASIPAAALASVLGKFAFQIPRPNVVFHADGLVQVTASLGHLNSFPSGHSITAFAVVAALGASLIRVPRRADQRLMMVAGLMLASAVGASRLALGQHWPLDVLAGALCGWMAGLHGAWLQRTRLAAWDHHCVSRLKLHVLFALLGVNGVALLLRTGETPLAQALLWLLPLLGMMGAARLYARRTWSSTPPTARPGDWQTGRPPGLT